MTEQTLPSEATRAQIEAISAQLDSNVDLVPDGLTGELLSLPGAVQLVRSSILQPLVVADRADQALAILDKIIALIGGDLEMERYRCSLLPRVNRRKDAIELAQQLAAAGEEAPGFTAQRIQWLMQEDCVGEAADLALAQPDWPTARVAQLALLALNRAGLPEKSWDLFARYNAPITPEVAALAIAAGVAVGAVDGAILAGKRALSAGADSASLQEELGRAYLQNRDPAQASKHLAASVEQNPDSVRALGAYGEVLVELGRFSDAVAPLAAAIKRAPNLLQLRAVYARALKGHRDYDGAAREMLEVVRRDPGTAWKRQAASALNQAGREQEASGLFGEMIADRRAGLPKQFDLGLNQLWDDVDTVQIPQARLDWAWQLRGSPFEAGRDEWERRARWGYLADQLLYDWLECKVDTADQAMWHLGDLGKVSEFFAPLMAQGRGIVLASAHIGPMFAGPLALELLGIPTCWLASTPSVRSSDHNSSLISTSDQTEAQVVRQALGALGEGKVLIVAADGAMNMAAPRIQFEGEEITYSSFAARLAFRRKSPSIFAIPHWVDEKLEFRLEHMPSPQEKEAVTPFLARWRASYLKFILEELRGEPENLRFRGGVWRHVRSDHPNAQDME